MCRCAEYEIDFLPKIKVEIATSDDQWKNVIETIQEKAQTGKIGDGKIFVYDMDKVIRIRTGEMGETAI